MCIKQKLHAGATCSKIFSNYLQNEEKLTSLFQNGLLIKKNKHSGIMVTKTIPLCLPFGNVGSGRICVSGEHIHTCFHQFFMENGQVFIAWGDSNSWLGRSGTGAGCSCPTTAETTSRSINTLYNDIDGLQLKLTVHIMQMFVESSPSYLSLGETKLV
jgi:hypothetical protein